jgi:hypothetical protein
MEIGKGPSTKFNHKQFSFGKEEEDVRYVHNLLIIVVLIPPILVALERQVQSLVFNKVQIRRDLLLDPAPPSSQHSPAPPPQKKSHTGCNVSPFVCRALFGETNCWILFNTTK